MIDIVVATQCVAKYLEIKNVKKYTIYKKSSTQIAFVCGCSESFRSKKNYLITKDGMDIRIHVMRTLFCRKDKCDCIFR